MALAWGKQYNSEEGDNKENEMGMINNDEMA